MSARPTFAAGWLLLAAVGLMLLPDGTQATIRLAVGDAFRPGYSALKLAEENFLAIKSRWSASPPPALSERDDLQAALTAAQQRNRELELQLAAIHVTIAAHQPQLFAGSENQQVERLAGPVLISAAVMGQSSAFEFRNARWLNQGANSGLIEEAPILKSERPLVDVGRDFDISQEDKLILGKSIIGKVEYVGHWTSTFLLVTDSEFRGRAQLVRPASGGYVFGPKGILKGDGKGACRLEGVPAAESVEIGDSVYTADRDGISPAPLFYGTVTQADLDERERSWRITVRPIERPENLTTVQVLRTAVNRHRMLAN